MEDYASTPNCCYFERLLILVVFILSYLFLLQRKVPSTITVGTRIKELKVCDICTGWNTGQWRNQDNEYFCVFFMYIGHDNITHVQCFTGFHATLD